MAKWWSILFGVTMLACGLLFMISPFIGWWLPEGVSTHAAAIDSLFYVILYITGFFFFLTEGLLVCFIYSYGSQPGQRLGTTNTGLPPHMRPLAAVVKFIPKFLHHEHRIEMAWTIVPAFILLYIAFAQVDTWANVKYLSRAPKFEGQDVPLQVGVSARQFEWRMRYPSSTRVMEWLGKKGDAKTKKDFETFKVPQFDDVHVVNEMHVWKGQPSIVLLSTRDVIHSYNMPHFRVKQDALPGREIPVWFTPIKANTAPGPDGSWLHGVDPKSKQTVADLNWDIPCAELCGWGHYRMIAKVYVHETRDDFLAWLRSVEARNTPPQAEQK